MDCLQADQIGQGASFADTLPGTLGVFAVPGWSGAVNGAPVPGPVDADVLLSQAPPRAEVGEEADLVGASLRLRLTEAQRTAWLGSATSVPVTGAVVVHGERSAEESQTVAVSRTVTVASRRPGVALAAAGDVDLDVDGDGRDRPARRPRDLARRDGGRGDAHADPDARDGGRSLSVRAAAALRRRADADREPAPTPTPTATAVPTVAPSPTAVPTVAAKAGVASVRSSKLKVVARRVAVSVRCVGATACRGTVRLATAAKVKLGKRAARTVTLAAAAKYSVRAGATATVRLALSRDGRSVLAAHRAVRVEVKLSGGTSGKLTLRR